MGKKSGPKQQNPTQNPQQTPSQPKPSTPKQAPMQQQQVNTPTPVTPSYGTPMPLGGAPVETPVHEGFRAIVAPPPTLPPRTDDLPSDYVDDGYYGDDYEIGVEGLTDPQHELGEKARARLEEAREREQHGYGRGTPSPGTGPHRESHSLSAHHAFVDSTRLENANRNDNVSGTGAGRGGARRQGGERDAHGGTLDNQELLRQFREHVPTGKVDAKKVEPKGQWYAEVQHVTKPKEQVVSQPSTAPSTSKFEQHGDFIIAKRRESTRKQATGGPAPTTAGARAVLERKYGRNIEERDAGAQVLLPGDVVTPAPLAAPLPALGANPAQSATDQLVELLARMDPAAKARLVQEVTGKK